MKFEKLDIKETEKELEVLIKDLKIGNKISVAWVKDFTYNFDAPDNKISDKYFGVLFDLLPKNISEKDFAEAVRVFNNVWNSFPQKIMGGISPQDKMFEGLKKSQKEELVKNKDFLRSDYIDKNLIEKHFATAERDLDKYLDWAYKEVLPNYDKSLKNSQLDEKEKRELVGVAGVFLEICGQMGMLDFRRIHPGFIKDFPEMFIETVTGPKISQDKIAEYLSSFILFLETFYGLEFILKE